MGWVATLDTATLAGGATEDTANMVSATAVDTPPLDTLDSATLVVTTASVRLRLSPRLMLMLRLIPTTDMATPDLATLASGATEVTVLATAVATSEDMATATAVVMDTTVRLKQPKDQHNAGAQLSPELASVSALSYLTAGYYLATKESKLK